MGNLVELKKLGITLNRKTTPILELLDTVLSRYQLDRPVASGEAAPETEEKRSPGFKNKLLGSLGSALSHPMGSDYRAFKSLDLMLDGPAFAFWKSYQKLLTKQLLATGKNYIDLENESCDSRFVSVYHILLKMGALALCDDMAEYRDGDVLLKAASEFCAELVKNQLLSRDASEKKKRFVTFLSTAHKRFLMDMTIIVKVIKVIHAPQTAFSLTSNRLNQLRMRIVRQICASLSPKLKPDELGPSGLETRFESLELEVFRGTLELQLVGQYVKRANKFDLNQRCQAVDTYVEKKHQAHDLKKLYELLYKTDRLSDLVSALDGLINATSWTLLVSGVMDLKPLIEGIRLHWDDCQKVLSLEDEHWLYREHRKSWEELEHQDSVGPLSPIESTLRSDYGGLETLQDENTLKLLSRFLATSFSQIKSLQQEFSQEGFDYSGLLKLDIFYLLQIAPEPAPSARSQKFVLMPQIQENYFVLNEGAAVVQTNLSSNEKSHEHFEEIFQENHFNRHPTGVPSMKPANQAPQPESVPLQSMDQNQQPPEEHKSEAPREANQPAANVPRYAYATWKNLQLKPVNDHADFSVDLHKKLYLALEQGEADIQSYAKKNKETHYIQLKKDFNRVLVSLSVLTSGLVSTMTPQQLKEACREAVDHAEKQLMQEIPTMIADAKRQTGVWGSFVGTYGFYKELQGACDYHELNKKMGLQYTELTAGKDSEIAELRRQLEERDKEINRLGREVRDLSSDKTKLENTIATQDSRIERLDKTAETSADTIKGLEQALNTSLTTINGLKDAIKDLSKSQAAPTSLSENPTVQKGDGTPLTHHYNNVTGRNNHQGQKSAEPPTHSNSNPNSNFASMFGSKKKL